MTDDTRTLDSHCMPAFNPAFVPVQVDDDTLHVRGGPWSGPALTIRDTDSEGLLGRLLDSIDGSTTVQTILSTFEERHRDEIRSVLDRLADHDIVRAETDTDPVWPHMALKYRFQHTERDRLADKSVLVVACDDMGRSIAADLLEMGVGSIALTQPHGRWYPLEDDRLTYHDAPDLRALIAAVDLVVYTADRMRSLVAELNELAIDTQTPLLPVQIHGFDGIVGPTVFPGETACYECFRERTMANVAGQAGFEAYRTSLESDDRLSTATLPAFSRLLSGFAAMELLHLLAYGTGYTAGRVVTIDSLELSMDANDVLTVPRCDCCGVAPGSDVQRFVSMDDVVRAGTLREAHADASTAEDAAAVDGEVEAE
ncbi:MAG: TOMM precursor leader peptide-binding protein [Halobacteriota archaeon]